VGTPCASSQHAATNRHAHPGRHPGLLVCGDPASHRKLWFEQDAAFDTTCARLAAARDAAKANALDAWAETPKGGLALLILCRVSG
jgi:hypothetical protein